MEHVLVIDEDPRRAGALTLLLEDFGCRVQQAGGAAEALVKLHRDCFDVVVLDLELSLMESWIILRRARQEGGAFPPIVVLASTEEAAEWIGDYRPAAFLVKPAPTFSLLGAIKGVSATLQAGAAQH